MAFNTNNLNNDDNKKNYAQETYSHYNVSNTECNNPSKLSYSFWNGNLCISIAPMKKNNDDISFDYDNAAKIYLTHHNARIFGMLIREVLSGKDHKSVSVSTRSGSLITFAKGSEIGASADEYCLLIRKINEQTGKPESTYTYLFKSEYYNGIINYNAANAKFDTKYFAEVEIDEMLAVIDTYVASMTGAYGYAVREEMKYDMSRLNTKADSICSALGVLDKPNYNKNNNQGSYFTNNRTNTTKTTSIDDLDDGLD